ncbi:5'-nucleotidase C-terminal domain-containing protein [Winogradskyella litoriviva]|uniref:5'-nucleotidase C-terminal domain-containing protein n=1 Tax=Winogradskyella litoriviva TaxID=1220182 RepID=UPI001F50FF87|nr:5'-nucleotidase [Winogradskyella litoriviva]
MLLIFSCASPKISKTEGERLNIDEKLEPNEAVEAFIKPYREHVNKDMNNIISYAPETYTKSDGDYNTAIGNFMADAVYMEGNPIFNKRTGNNIDFVLLNHGGIRSIISKGDITTKTAFEIMPFENSVVIVELKGEQVNEMMQYLAKAKRAHPVSNQLQLTLDKDGNIVSATIKGEPIDASKTYFVATNDYLFNGGDGMVFFSKNESLHVLNYKIRDVLLDNFKKKDTINPKQDKRFIQLND